MADKLDNGSCSKHSGVCAEISHLEVSDRDQWVAINSIKGTLTSTLTAVIITLIVALLNLGMMLYRTGGGIIH